LCRSQHAKSLRRRRQFLFGRLDRSKFFGEKKWARVVLLHQKFRFFFFFFCAHDETTVFMTALFQNNIFGHFYEWPFFSFLNVTFHREKKKIKERSQEKKKKEKKIMRYLG
jgi:hypothetical protein